MNNKDNLIIKFNNLLLNYRYNLFILNNKNKAISKTFNEGRSDEKFPIVQKSDDFTGAGKMSQNFCARKDSSG